MSATQQRPVTQGARVADKVLQTFDYACVMGDYETATALLTVLVDLTERKARRFGGDRRSSSVDLAAARQRLQRMRASEPWDLKTDNQAGR
jgi:hypothetical protein